MSLGSRRKRSCKSGAFGENPHSRAGEARRRFTSGSDEKEEDGEGLLVRELSVVHRFRAHPEQRTRVVPLGSALLDEHVYHRTDVHHRSAELVEAFVGHEAAITSTEA